MVRVGEKGNNLRSEDGTTMWVVPPLEANTLERFSCGELCIMVMVMVLWWRWRYGGGDDDVWW